MSKKKIKLNFLYDAPVTLTFAILAVIIFILYTTVLKDKIGTSILISPTSSKGTLPFSFKDPLSYFRLIFHILGFTDKSVLISDLIFILLLGPQMEERYGSVVIGVMIFVSALFSGVLNACFCVNPICGASAPVFMLILLYALMFLTKKKISATSLAIIILFVFREVIQGNPNGIVGVVINIAGGLCGSLFALLTSPKARTARKEQSSAPSYKDDDKTVVFKPKKSPEQKKSSSKYNDSDDETVVGTIKF